MTTALAGVKISPVNMEDRQALGIKSGDTVKVHQKIQDKGKTRLQVFEGLVLAVKHGTEPGATFTVRKVASGVGVEKIFPLYSPNIDKIEIVKRVKGKRSKLYYIREKVAREIKRQMRNMSIVSMASESEAEATQKAAEAAEKKAADEAAAAEAEAAKKAEEEAKVAEADTSEETTEEPAVEEKTETESVEEVKEETAEEKPEETEAEKKS